MTKCRLVAQNDSSCGIMYALENGMFVGRQEEISQLEEVAEKVQRLQVAKGVSIRTALVYDGKLRI